MSVTSPQRPRSVEPIQPLHAARQGTGTNIETDLNAAVTAAVAAGQAEADCLGSVVSAASDRIRELADALSSGNRDDTGGVTAAFTELASAAQVDLTDHFARQRQVLGAFNIALFGRTGAGKSSLLSALARLDGSRVSRGESDWTVDVEPVVWEGCRLYDTPGINGWGRTRSRDELEAAARRAVEVADVVLLCFDSQSQQALEFKKVAAWVQEYGKPVVAVLNPRNPMWRHSAKVPDRARANLSKSVRQHAGNIRDELTAIGLGGTPVVAVQAQRALDARAAQPYDGPDAKNHVKRRNEFGVDYLETWSNLPCLEHLLAATVATGGTQLRTRVLREGVRATLNGWRETVEEAAAEALQTVSVTEEAIEKALSVLGYPEPENRQALTASSEPSDPLSVLEGLRGKAFTSPSVGRLSAHLTHLIASRFGAMRAESLRQASAVVRRAFDDGTTVSGADFHNAVFDDERLEDATRELWKTVGSFLRRELDLTWEEAASDLAANERLVRVRGRAGRGLRNTAHGLRALGLVSGAASTVLGVIAATQFWNPVGWVAAVLIGGTGLLSGALGWLGKKARERAERQRLSARSDALAQVRLAVGDAYFQMEDEIRRRIESAAWESYAPALVSLTQQSAVLRQAADAAGALVDDLTWLIDDIPTSPNPGDVLKGACELVVASRSSGTRPDDVWLGEDWLEADNGTVDASAETPAPLLSLVRHDAAALSSRVAKMFSDDDTESAEAWLEKVERAATGLLAASDASARAAACRGAAPGVVLVGDYSSGKTSLIKRLHAEAGIQAPDLLVVRGDPTTARVHSYPWRHLTLIDTPGLQAARTGDDEAAITAVSEAALVLVVLHVNLLIGDLSRLKAILAGTTTSGPTSSRTLFLINRCDEFGVDPTGDTDEFASRRANKEAELRTMLEAHGLPHDGPVHVIAADPYGLVGDTRPVRRDDYTDASRSWDGVGALVETLTSTTARTAQMQTQAAMRAAHNTLLGARQCLNFRLRQAEREAEDAFALWAEIDDTIFSGKLLAASLEQQAALVVRAHAERAAANALTAPADALDAVAEATAEWWRDPVVHGDAADFWKRAEREIERWAVSSSSAVGRRSVRLASDPMAGIRPRRKPPKRQRRGAGRRLANAARRGGHAARLLGDRDIVYAIGKAFKYRFRPWGAVKGAARVSRVGAVLGTVAVGFDALSWVQQERGHHDEEAHRRTLAEFVETSIAEVTTRLTHGRNPDGPLTVLEAAIAEYERAAADSAKEAETRDAAVAGLRAELRHVLDLLEESPLPFRPDQEQP